MQLRLPCRARGTALRCIMFAGRICFVQHRCARPNCLVERFWFLQVSSALLTVSVVGCALTWAHFALVLKGARGRGYPHSGGWPQHAHTCNVVAAAGRAATHCPAPLQHAHRFCQGFGPLPCLVMPWTRVESMRQPFGRVYPRASHTVAASSLGRRKHRPRAEDVSR